MKKTKPSIEVYDEKHWLVDLVYNWLESVVLEGALGGLPELGFAYAAGEIAGHARSLGLDTTPMRRIALGATLYKDGEGTKALKDADRFCQLLLDRELGSPWKPAEAEPPAGWHGPLCGTQDEIAWFVGASEAETGGRRTLIKRMRRDKHLWGRELNRKRSEMWFANQMKFEEALEVRRKYLNDIERHDLDN